jgi:hypothetical protein
MSLALSPITDMVSQKVYKKQIVYDVYSTFQLYNKKWNKMFGKHVSLPFRVPCLEPRNLHHLFCKLQ